ncbi:MAG: BtrH N-terminal domain-containing protein [Lachnospiraceae bacterium]|nr:BtrH N-terminal domain-containing protein [Lachnospiraceae bacterium]
MKKVLDIVLPSLSGYMEDAYPLSLLETKRKTCEWIYSGYVQLVFQTPELCSYQPLKFFKISPSGKSWDPMISWFNTYSITKKMAKSLNLKIIDLMRNSIDMGYYVNIHLDEYYLPHANPYKSFHYTHITLIFGYDDEKMIFYALSYNFKGDFNNVEINYYDLEISYEGEGDTNQQALIELWEWREHYGYNFSVKRLLSQCNAYLTGDNNYIDIKDFYNQKNNNVYGLDIYEKLKGYSKISNNVIPFQIIREHKQLMYQRINFMIENEYINKDDYFLIEGNEIVDKAIILKNLFMKSVVSENKKILGKIDEAIDWLYNHEKIYFAKLIKALENYDRKEFIFSEVGEWNEIKHKLNHYPDTKNGLKVGFDITFINNHSIGYIGIGNQKNFANYELPLSFNIDTIANTFIGNRDSVPFEIPFNITKGKVFSFSIIFDFEKQKCNLKIIADNEYKKENINMVVNFDYSGEIFVYFIHENGYRFKVRLHT